MNCGKEVDDKSKVGYARLGKKKLVSGRRNEKVVIEVEEGWAVSS